MGFDCIGYGFRLKLRESFVYFSGFDHFCYIFYGFQTFVWLRKFKFFVYLIGFDVYLMGFGNCISYRFQLYSL